MTSYTVGCQFGTVRYCVCVRIMYLFILTDRVVANSVLYGAVCLWLRVYCSVHFVLERKVVSIMLCQRRHNKTQEQCYYNCTSVRPCIYVRAVPH